ncbi:MAG: TIR domain-containing protein [Erysipelotrichaceae bacterium]|nr:TIR domain-containing protein [Erysipelotrichaceae bacterium]
MAHDVFISYSHKDGNVAQAICAKLEEQKIRCWYAPRNIQAGEEWASSIMNALKATKIMVLVFTDYSNASVQVKREVDNAINNGVTVIPFKLTKNDPSGGMEYYLSTLHWLDAMNKPMEDAIDDLYIMIRNILDGKKIGGEEDWHKNKKGKFVLTRQAVIKILISLPILLLGILFVYIFFDNPAFNNTVPVAVGGFGLAGIIASIYLIASVFVRNKGKKYWFSCFVICSLLIILSIVRAIMLEMNSPADMSIVAKSQEESMNMANFATAVYDEKGTVYYADYVGNEKGVYKSSLKDFYEGKEGTCLVSGSDADYLTLSGDGKLVFREYGDKARKLCVYDLATGKMKVLRRTDTGKYYANKDWILYMKYSGTASSYMITTDGSYETGFVDEEIDFLYVYKGVPYFLNVNGELSAQSFSNRSLISPYVQNLFIIYDDVIYYCGLNGSGIYKASLDDTSAETKISNSAAIGMVVHDGYLYFINYDQNCSLYRISLSTGEEELFDRRSFSSVNIIVDCLYLYEVDKGYVRLMLK